jgi:hypothetical protein
MIYTGYEEISDLGDVSPQSRILYELDCPDRILRELSIDLNISGRTGGSKQTRRMEIRAAGGQWSGATEAALLLGCREGRRGRPPPSLPDLTAVS